jgi:hypothetical protein
VIDPQPAKTGLAFGDQMVARQPLVVDAITHREARLGGDEQAAAAPFHGLAEDFLGAAARVDIGGVDDIDPGVDADVELALRAGHVRRACLGEEGLSAEGHGAEGEDGNFQSGAPEEPIFHVFSPKILSLWFSVTDRREIWRFGLRYQTPGRPVRGGSPEGTTPRMAVKCASSRAA